MTKIVVNNKTRTVSVHQTGRRGIQGKPGLTWRDDEWQVGSEYAKDDALLHDGSSYRARLAHIASAETEPGAGADWESVWKVLALGTDVETAEVVAGIAGAIETVAGISEAVETVAENKEAVVTVADKVEDVATVAERIEDVSTVAAADEAIRIAANRDAQIAIVAERDSDIALLAEHAAAIEATAGIAGQVVTVSDNAAAVVLAAAKIAEIEAAPGAAEDSREYRNQSRGWAEGTEPGGPGTKSSREYAEDAATAVARIDGVAAGTLFNKNVATIREGCVRNLPDLANLQGTQTETGHTWTGLTSRDGTGTPILRYRSGGWIEFYRNPQSSITGGSALVEGIAPILIGGVTDTDKLFRRIRVSLDIRAPNNWGRGVLINYIDENNWLGLWFTYTTILLLKVIDGVATTLASLSVLGSRGYNSSISNNIEIVACHAHVNFSTIGVCIDVFWNYERIFRFPLTADEQIFRDTIGRSGIASGALTRLYGFTLEYGQ